MTHPELVRIEDLIRRLEDGMESGGEGAEKTLFARASEYAELCARANVRLQTCAEILSKGKDKEYQALMTATRAPDVLDLCAILSELQTDEWRGFCQRNHLPVPDPINERAKQQIDPLYERAGSFQKELMAEYSAANSKRDFREALRIIRKVATLNPGDVNSVKQAAALEDRLLREVITKLANPLREGNREEILVVLDEIEELAPGRVPKESDRREAPWRDALEIRREVRREAAIDESGRLVAEARAAREAEDLDEVLRLVGRVSALAEEYEFVLRPDLRAEHAAFSDWASEEVRKLKIEDQYQAKLRELRTTLKTIRDKEFQSSKPGLDELRDDALTIRRQWKEISEFQKPVPTELQDDARKLLGEVEEKVALKQRAKRRNLITLVSTGSIVLIALAVAAFLFWTAGQMNSQLERALADERASDLERRIGELETGRPVWMSLAGLPATIEKGKTWLELEKAQAARVEGTLDGIESDLNSNPDATSWSSVSLSAMRTRIDGARTAAAEVNEDFRSNMEDRLIAADRSWGDIAERKRNEVSEEFHGMLAELDAKIREALAKGPSPAERNASVTEISALVTKMETLAGAELDELKPLTADLTSFDILKEKYSTMETQVTGAREILNACRAATDLDSYMKAIGKLVDTEFIEGTEKIGLGNLLRKARSEDVLLREILVPDDLAFWTSLTGNLYSEQGYPESVDGAEKGLFLGLRDDESLSKVYSYPMKGGRPRMVYSRGDKLDFEPSRTNDTVTIRVSGRSVYDPETMGTEEVVFAPAQYRRIESPAGTSGFAPDEPSDGLSPESTFFKSLRLGDYADSTVSNYRGTFLEAAEKVIAADEDVSPLFLAYLYIQFGDLMLKRQRQWLVDFCDFEQHHSELKGLVGLDLSSTDWCNPEKEREFGEILAEFFSRHRGAKYAKPARAAHQFYARMVAGGIRYAGFIGMDGNLQMTNDPGDDKEFWGLDENLEVVRIFSRGESGELRELVRPRQFSPVFALGRDADAVVVEASEAALLDPGDESLRKRIPLALRPASE